MLAWVDLPFRRRQLLAVRRLRGLTLPDDADTSAIVLDASKWPVPANLLVDGGVAPPLVSVVPPGPRSRQALATMAQVAAPMGPRGPKGSGPGPVVVYAQSKGCNVVDVDGNRYVDFAAGFGSLLLGHQPPAVMPVLHAQADCLLQSLGDVHPSAVKIELLQALAALHPTGEGQCVVGQSGSDSIAAALKTAVLYTGRPGVVAFRGAYHGLSYGPLALCSLRDSYRKPFAEQLNSQVSVVDYPEGEGAMESTLQQVERALATGAVGAVVYEPIAGRAGCLVPPSGFGLALRELTTQFGALLIADEIWTGLGRAGHWLQSAVPACNPDLICLGKGLGGGLPISACIGSKSVMAAWSQPQEVVHTSTFAGAPLAAACANALLRELHTGGWVERAARIGDAWVQQLTQRLTPLSGVRAVRGRGLMVGIEVQAVDAGTLQSALLRAGYLVSSGGGGRESLVLTPPLTISEQQLAEFTEVLVSCCEQLP